jgi:polysaccharide pyruvyl transferase WcaK-like protein
MKIGILTYHHVVNDGAVLQTVGHVNTLRELFPQATIEVIDYRHKTFEQIEFRDTFKGLVKFKKGTLSRIKKYYSFKRFVGKLLPLSQEKLITDDVQKAVEFINRQNYDYILVGSDEVWKILDKKYSRKFPNIYWLPKEIKAKRIASAASANGSNPKLLTNPDVLKNIKEITNGFHAIAVRDQYTFDLIKSVNVEAPLYQVPDPTFGVEFKASGVKEKLQKAGVDFTKKRFALNLSSNNPEFAIASEQIAGYAKKNNIQLVGIGQFNKYCVINFSDILNSVEWATCYQFFDFCITDRFHSTIFSVKNKIPFMVIESNKKYPNEHKGKIVDLLRKMNKINHHYFFDKNTDFVNEIEKLILEFNDKDFEEIVLNQKKQFREHLINSLN